MTRVSVPEIIGRRAELAALDAMRSGGLALISGDAGVGKSRLVETFVDRLAPGTTVLSGGCLQFETDVPYAPFAEALPGLFDDLQDRAAGYRRVAEAIVAAGDQVVLVLEDLHWADASTRDLLLYLSRALARTPVLLVLTCRTDEFAAAHPVAALLAELTRAPHAERLHLEPLDRAEVTTLAGAVLGTTPGDELVDTLMVRAEGNPFFTEELLAAGDAVPYNVHEIVASRLARLSDRAHRLARLASVVGRTVPHDLLVGLDPEPSLGAALRELVDHGQLVTVEPDSYTFRHALIHESLYRDLLPGERRSAHARVARCLDSHPELASGRSAAGAAAELARHWAAAADPVRALASSVRAAEAAEAGLAPVEAHAHYERALEFWAAVPEPDLALDTLLERAAEAASLAGHNQRAVELTSMRLSELDSRADPVRAALAYEQLSYQARSAGNWTLAREASQKATRLQPPDSPARLRLESWLMMLDMLSAHHLDAVRRAERLLPAVSGASGTEDQMPLNRALTALGTGSVMIGHIDAGVEFLRRHHEFAHSSGTPRFVGVCYVNMSESLIWADRQEEALALARTGVERAPEYGFDIYLLPIVGNVVRALAELHRWDEAVDTTGDPNDPAADPFNWVFVDLPRADVLIKRGELAAASELVRRIGAVLDGQDDVQYGTELADLRARLAAREGRTADALAAVHEGLRVALSGQDLWLVARLVATGVAIDPAAADELLAAGREHRNALVAQGVTPLPRTLRAWRLAEAEATPTPSAWAEVAEHAGVDRYLAAYARYREAEALLTAKGSRRRAASALAWATSEATSLGAVPLADLAARLASRAGLTTGPTTPFAGLTAREVEILTLVGRGLTNAEIGAELFISTKTASVHVSNILRKLGLKSRIQAASLAHRHLPHA